MQSPPCIVTYFIISRSSYLYGNNPLDMTLKLFFFFAKLLNMGFTPMVFSMYFSELKNVVNVKSISSSAQYVTLQKYFHIQF